MTLFTIGYEGLDIDTFLARLAACGIDTVVDVRDLPVSRKSGFSKKALSARLEAEGLHYVHMAGLGCPKPIREHVKAGGDQACYEAAFNAHLATREDDIAALAGLARTSRAALLCFEADPRRCHRTMVAEAVRERFGLAVEALGAAR
ncbi:DUF488 domain-containing protein [Paludibacterium paludis]|uniref:DUF488 domain-containing protein n=1 Tax=Paludibacterium paludis TaxID=1225769 RepID=A0A918U7D7_9NEIS|nr:DUF488 domain-containing protein [Paludibacterium paludis]GGY05128.1 hypothetical protein GCM10011289_04620 [Paludibacterium paludis]